MCPMNENRALGTNHLAASRAKQLQFIADMNETFDAATIIP
jgi:hypothetical protein